VCQHAPPASTVRRQSTPHFECRQREPRHLECVASAPLRQAIELPDARADAPCRDDDGGDRKLYVAALHNVTFSARDRRRMAASRRNALPRSVTVS